MPLLTLTDGLEDAIAAAVAQGVPIETAAAAAGVSEGSVQNWLQAAHRSTWPQSGARVSNSAAVRLVRFAARIRQAQAEWEAKQVAGIARAAEIVNEKTGQQDWRARAWLLNNHPRTRATYHEQKEVEVTRVEPFHELEQAKALPDQELLAEYNRLNQPSLPEPDTETRPRTHEAGPGGLAGA